MKKKVIIPLATLLSLILVIILIGQIGRFRNSKVDSHGIMTAAELFGESKRRIKVKYQVNGRTYIHGDSKPFSGIIDGEKYTLKYLEDNPDRFVVYYDQPYIQDSTKFNKTKCESLSKEMSVLKFTYNVNGIKYQRNALFRNQSIDINNLQVLYKINNPKVAYLISR